MEFLQKKMPNYEKHQVNRNWGLPYKITFQKIPRSWNTKKFRGIAWLETKETLKLSITGEYGVNPGPEEGSC